MSSIKDNAGRIFWGLVLIAVGGLFLLDTMDLADFGHLISIFWPAIPILIGAWILVSSGGRNILTSLILIVLGAIFLLINLDVLKHSVWNYAWPLAIVAAGLWLLARPGIRRTQGKFPELKVDDLDSVNIFSGVKRTVSSQKFRGGRAQAIFGGMELDLTQAALDGGQATIDLTAIFGGIDVWVPREWKVVVDATPVLGGVDDHHRSVPDAEAKGTLYIKATAIFGGIDIKN